MSEHDLSQSTENIGGWPAGRCLQRRLEAAFRVRAAPQSISLCAGCRGRTVRRGRLPCPASGQRWRHSSGRAVRPSCVWVGAMAWPVGPKMRPFRSAGVCARAAPARFRGLSAMMACTLSQSARSTMASCSPGWLCSLVHGLADVEPVVEELVDKALVDRLAALVQDALPGKFGHQPRGGAEPDEALEDHAGRAPPRPRSRRACGPSRRSRAAPSRPSTCRGRGRRRTCRGCARRSPPARTGRRTSGC